MSHGRAKLPALGADSDGAPAPGNSAPGNPADMDSIYQVSPMRQIALPLSTTSISGGGTLPSLSTASVTLPTPYPRASVDRRTLPSGTAGGGRLTATVADAPNRTYLHKLLSAQRRKLGTQLHENRTGGRHRPHREPQHHRQHHRQHHQHHPSPPSGKLAGALPVGSLRPLRPLRPVLPAPTPHRPQHARGPGQHRAAPPRSTPPSSLNRARPLAAIARGGGGGGGIDAGAKSNITANIDPADNEAGEDTDKFDARGGGGGGVIGGGIGGGGGLSRSSGGPGDHDGGGLGGGDPRHDPADVDGGGFSSGGGSLGFSAAAERRQLSVREREPPLSDDDSDAVRTATLTLWPLFCLSCYFPPCNVGGGGERR